MARDENGNYTGPGGTYGSRGNYGGGNYGGPGGTYGSNGNNGGGNYKGPNGGAGYRNSSGSNGGGGKGFFDRLLDGPEKFVENVFNNPRAADRQLQNWNRLGATITNTVDGTIYNTHDARYGKDMYRMKDQELTAQQRFEARQLGMSQREYRQALYSQNMGANQGPTNYNQFPPSGNGYYVQGPQNGAYGYQPLPNQNGAYYGAPTGKGAYWNPPANPQTDWNPTFNGVAGTPASAPVSAPAVTTTPAPAAASEAAATPAATEPKVEAKPEPITWAGSASTATAQAYRLKAQPAPEKIDIAPEQVKPLQQLMAEVPELKAIMATKKFPNGDDGLFGPRTEKAIKFVAEKAGLNLKDIKFRDAKNPNTIKFFETLAEMKSPVAKAPAAEVAKGPTEAELAAQKAADAAKAAWAQEQALEAQRPKIVVDLPNGMRRGATIKNLVSGSMRGDGGERIEFNGPEGQHNKILKEYVGYVREAMDARGMDASKGDAKETAALILAAYNGMSATDQVQDLQRLRMPSQRDIHAAIDTMGTNVLLDGKISSRELKLNADVVERVVFGERIQLSNQIAMASSMPTGGDVAPPPSTPTAPQAGKDAPAKG